MKRYLLKEQEIENEYRYIFLCGAKYVARDNADKRNVLREFLKQQNENYRPIILEDNFIFRKDSSRFLVYDDIHMKDLYQVEMLTNYLSDCNFIIHESISTGAETGLFLSEEQAVRKTCLLVPDEMAVEEGKIGQFIRLAFMRQPNAVKVITFYPRIENKIVSENVRYWHTYFYEDRIGPHLQEQILGFLEQGNRAEGIRFTKSMARVAEGMIHYNIARQTLHITLQPRSLLCCVGAVFNIVELQKKIFHSDKRELRAYIQDVKECLMQVFIHTIEEREGADIRDCAIHARMNVTGVYIAEIIGMCFYLFQAAGFLQIKKDDDYISNHKVGIERKMLVYPDGTKHFFHEKYKDCIDCAVETQIV